MTQNAHPRHRPFMQAPVKALDPHGVTVISYGTIAFALGVVGCWLSADYLNSIGKSWWLATALTGLGIGCLALTVLLLRRARINRQAPPQA